MTGSIGHFWGFLVWPMSLVLTQRAQGLYQHCSQPLGSDKDILNSLLRNQIIHLYNARIIDSSQCKVYAQNRQPESSKTFLLYAQGSV